MVSPVDQRIFSFAEVAAESVIERVTESPKQTVDEEAEALTFKTSIITVSEQVTPFTVRSTQYVVFSVGLTQMESPVSLVDQLVVELGLKE